jgi:hypothetical protein
MFRAKGIHKKSKLDECKKFDEECKLRYVAEKMIQRNKKIFFVSTPTRQMSLQEWILKNKHTTGELVGPKPAHINPFFGLNSKEKKELKKRIKLFKKESKQVYNGIEKFRDSINASWGIPYTARILPHLRKLNP